MEKESGKLTSFNEGEPDRNVVSHNKIEDARTENGDVFIGNKYSQYNLNFSPPDINPEQMVLLVDRYKDIDCESDEFLAIKEELEEYRNPSKERKIIGLEGKLIQGGRQDLIASATEYKDKFARRLMRYELCTHTSAIHLNLMSRVEEIFNTEIKPRIESGVEDDVVDIAVSKLIIEPLSKEVSVADPTLTPKQVRGMMFLLTGNCFLKW